MSALKIEIEDTTARILPGGGAAPKEVPLADLIAGITRRKVRKPVCSILPDGVRAWRERGDAVAMAIEIPPAYRTVRWIREDAPLPYGDDSFYAPRRLSLPYIIVLAVFESGHLTMAHQLYYRTAPLSFGEDLLFPNLLNVAPQAYGMKAWVCLMHLRIDPAASWQERVSAIVEHVLATGWNRSAEVHEGRSFFDKMREVDARVASIAAWEAASRADPAFALEVAWRPAETTVGAELERMLDVVAPARSITCADDLAGLATGATGRRRRRRLPWFL